MSDISNWRHLEDGGNHWWKCLLCGYTTSQAGGTLEGGMALGVEMVEHDRSQHPEQAAKRSGKVAVFSQEGFEGEENLQ